MSTTPASHVSRRTVLRTSTALGAGITRAAVLGTLPAIAQDATPTSEMEGAPTTPVETLTLAAAQRALQAALDTTATLGAPSCVFVVDTAGNVKASARQDGSGIASLTYAPAKAFTAAAFGTPTDELAKALGGDAVMVASLMQDSRVTLLGGGVPLYAGTALVGGIGVSGGTPEQDREAALAGAAVLAE